jgi:D-3-phosphoglycerate dehydrogenase / 2-oxoglutarate reductase
VDESALLEALEQGQIAGAALDVIAHEHEPRPAGDPLLQYARTHDNLLLTPHIGGLTFESREKTDLLLASLLLARNRVRRSFSEKSVSTYKC